jgi:hypothetical protein
MSYPQTYRVAATSPTGIVSGRSPKERQRSPGNHHGRRESTGVRDRGCLPSSLKATTCERSCHGQRKIQDDCDEQYSSTWHANDVHPSLANGRSSRQTKVMICEVSAMVTEHSSSR